MEQGKENIQTGDNKRKQTLPLDFDERIKICHACKDHRVSKGVGLTCGYFLNVVPKGGVKPSGKTCGCVMAVKASFAKFHCPQKKW